MFCAFLCGLLYGGLLYGVWQKEVERRRKERIHRRLNEWLNRPTDWSRVLWANMEEVEADGVGHPLPPMSAACYPAGADDLPFSDDPLPEDAELPGFITGGTTTSYDGEF